MSKKPKKPKLPPYVVVRDGRWHVRRAFPNKLRDAKGHIIYTQLIRRCLPHTEERARELSAAIARGYYKGLPDPTKLQTLSAFLAAFVLAKQSAVSIRTYQDYKALIKRYVTASRFGSMPVEDIKPLDVQTFYASLTSKGVSGKMVRKIHTVLSMAFNQGIRWEAVSRNPCQGVMLPRAAESEMEVWTQAEAKRFMAACFAEPERYLVLAFALETGMRPGEYLALRWSDIDLDKRVVTVSRAIAFPRSGSPYFKSPKTKSSRRMIYLSEQMTEHLRRRVKTHDLVFPSHTGTPIAPHNLGIRAMREVCDKAGLKHHSLYSLRHSCVTLSLAAGINIKTISEKLGHQGISITLQTYAHVLQNQRENAVDALAEALY